MTAWYQRYYFRQISSFQGQSRFICLCHLKMVSVEMVVLEGAEVHPAKRTLHGVTVPDAKISCLPRGKEGVDK